MTVLETTGERRLVAIHNVAEPATGFVLPLLSYPGSSNSLYVQVVTLDDRIAGFYRLSHDLPSRIVGDDIRLNAGDEVIHAFEMPDHSLRIDTRARLAPELVHLLNDESILRRPLFRLDLIEFCGARSALPEAIKSAFDYLAVVSDYSAGHWRDRLFLTPRVRRGLLRAVNEVKLARAVREEWWQSVVFSIKAGRAYLQVSQALLNVLARAEKWQEDLARDLQAYVEPFSVSGGGFELQIIDRMPSVSDAVERVQARRSDQVIESGVSRVIVPFGRKSLSAVKATYHPAAPDRYMPHLVDLADVRPEEADGVAALKEHLRTILEADAEHSGLREHPQLIAVIDLNMVCIKSAREFCERLPRDFDIIGVGVHEPGRGLLSSDVWDALSDAFARTILISDSGMPIGESNRPTRVGEQLNLLIEMLNDFQDRGLHPSRGVSAYSAGRTRHGVRNAANALSLAVASGANPSYSALNSADLYISIASVGEPSSDGEELKRHVNNIGKAINTRVPSMQTHWRRRRFVHGANIPTTVALLSSEIELSKGSDSHRLLDAARLVLASLRFNIIDVNHAAGTNAFEVRSEENISLTIVSNDNSVVEQGGVQSSPYVNLVADRGLQLRWFSQAMRLEALPLLVSDLIYLRGCSDLILAARIIAYLSQPMRALPELFHELVEAGIRASVRDIPERFKFHAELKKISRDDEVDDVAITIEKIARLDGYRARISGSVKFGIGEHTKLGEPALMETYFGDFSVLVGPRGLGVESITVDTSSFSVDS